MINNEYKYREELFELLKTNFNDNDKSFQLIREILISNKNDIDFDELLKKVTDL